jgi:hypothetical protein
MDVYVDNALVGTINQKHAASTYKARWDYTGQLSSGPHTLKLVFVTTSASTLGSVDAVIVRSASAQPAPTTTTAAAQPSPTATSVARTATSVPPTATSVPAQPTATTQPTSQPSAQETQYDSTQSAFVYSSGWVQETSAYAIGGSYARTSANQASVTFPFTGQSFSVIYKGGPAYRNMDVYVDGALVGTINQKHDASVYKARWDYTGQLPLGQHTLKLVFVTTGTTYNGSVDAVIVR